MKKKLWITSLLATMSIAAAAGGVALAKQDVAVTEAAQNWVVGDIDNKYAYGTSFNVPAATVSVNGDPVEATATVTYPDGLTVSTDQVLLNQAGKYTITYRAVAEGIPCVEEKEFYVENKGYLMQNENSSATYGSYTRFGANSNGLLVRLAPSDTITFTQLLDVSSTENIMTLFDLFITPDAFAAYDFSKLVITLTDAVDPSYYVRFQLRRYNAEDRGFNWGYIDVTFNGQPWVGYEAGNYRFNALGTPHTLTFSAAMHKGNQWAGEIVERAPDAGTCKVTFNPVTTEVAVQGAHMANLNNPALFEQAWKGWPSGKARISMTAEEVKGQTANFCIKSIMGVDLTQEMFTESEAPIVNVSMAQEEMPQGEVGRDYIIPSATAFDFYSGASTVKTAVYRDYASSSPISVGVVDGKFKPTTAGWHTIVYTAADALGNEGTAVRNVYVAEDLGEIEVSLPDVDSNATLGTWITLPEVSYVGDCGLASVQTTVTFGEETYEITDRFLPEYTGEWTVTYTVTDYIGRVGTASFTVNAQPGDTYVLLEELVLPKVFVSDCEYVLPTLYATDYSSGAPANVLCDVVVTDKNGDKTYKAGASFVPSVAENGTKVTVAYQCNGAEVAAKEVPTVLAKDEANGKVLALNYLYGEDIETSYKDENGEWYQAGVGVIAKESAELCGWTFVTPQLTNNFSMLFQGVKSLTNFDGLKITLTDKDNANEEIGISLMKKGNGTTMIVGDQALDVNNVTLETNGQYKLSYANGKFTFGGLTLTATETVNGEAFEGFSSNLVYVKVEMVNAKAGARYLFLSLNETNLSRRNQEVFAPNFQILGNFGGNQSLNSVYEIFPAIANDVFAPNVSLTMTVTAPDGSIVVDNNNVKLENVAPDRSYFVTMDQYGKYQATYTAVEKDWVTQNPLVITETVFVIDEQKPQVAFTNATQTTAKVGDTITMPDIVYQDNITAYENIRVVSGVYNPYGKYYRFEDGENAIKCAYEGTYKFIVMVFDEHGNMTSVTHTITVTKA